MPRRPHWHQMVESSKAEALNAVEFYNRPGGRRPLEAYLVHIHMAWVYLLQAEFDRQGIKYYYPDPKHPRRYLKVDGERKTWDLERCTRERWPDAADPVRKNLELTIRLRNKIEHRYESGLMVEAAGFTQALLLNYEEELVTQFGVEYSIGQIVHIPVALSTFTREGAARLLAASAGLPKRLQNVFVNFRSGLNDEILNDRRFEFRIDIAQKRAPKTDADLAVTFVHEDDLSESELEAYKELEKTGRIILRDKERPISNLGLMKPTAASEQVEAAIPFRFRVYSEFPQAWKHFKVRPLGSARASARKRTVPQYCVYDEPHDDYLYRPAFVELLIAECKTRDGFEKVIGRKPNRKSVPKVRAAK